MKTQNFFSWSHARDKTKNIFLYFFTELKTYHLWLIIFTKQSMFTSDVINLTPARIHLEGFKYSIFVDFDLILIFLSLNSKLDSTMSQNLFENFCYKNFNLVMMIVFWINQVAQPQAQLLFLQYFVIPVLFFDSTLFHFMRILLSFFKCKNTYNFDEIVRTFAL